MRCSADQKYYDTVLLLCDGLSVSGTGTIAVNQNANCSIPLLATIYCPKCKGTNWHLAVTHGLPNELVCDRCGNIIECRVES